MAQTEGSSVQVSPLNRSQPLREGDVASFWIDFDRLSVEARLEILQLLRSRYGFPYPLGIEDIYVRGKRLKLGELPDPPDGLLRILPPSGT